MSLFKWGRHKKNGDVEKSENDEAATGNSDTDASYDDQVSPSSSEDSTEELKTHDDQEDTSNTDNQNEAEEIRSSEDPLESSDEDADPEEPASEEEFSDSEPPDEDSYDFNAEENHDFDEDDSFDGYHNEEDDEPVEEEVLPSDYEDGFFDSSSTEEDNAHIDLISPDVKHEAVENEGGGRHSAESKEDDAVLDAISEGESYGRHASRSIDDQLNDGDSDNDIDSSDHASGEPEESMENDEEDGDEVTEETETQGSGDNGLVFDNSEFEGIDDGFDHGNSRGKHAKKDDDELTDEELKKKLFGEDEAADQFGHDPISNPVEEEDEDDAVDSEEAPEEEGSEDKDLHGESDSYYKTLMKKMSRSRSDGNHDYDDMDLDSDGDSSDDNGDDHEDDNEKDHNQGDGENGNHISAPAPLPIDGVVTRDEIENFNADYDDGFGDIDPAEDEETIVSTGPVFPDYKPSAGTVEDPYYLSDDYSVDREEKRKDGEKEDKPWLFWILLGFLLLALASLLGLLAYKHWGDGEIPFIGKNKDEVATASVTPGVDNAGVTTGPDGNVTQTPVEGENNSPMPTDVPALQKELQAERKARDEAEQKSDALQKENSQLKNNPKPNKTVTVTKEKKGRASTVTKTVRPRPVVRTKTVNRDRPVYRTVTRTMPPRVLYRPRDVVRTVTKTVPGPVRTEVVTRTQEVPGDRITLTTTVIRTIQ